MLNFIVCLTPPLISVFLFLILRGKRSRRWLSFRFSVSLTFGIITGVSFTLGLILVCAIPNLPTKFRPFILLGISFLATSLASAAFNFIVQAIKVFALENQIDASFLFRLIIGIFHKLTILMIFWLTLVTAFAGIYLGIIKLAPNSLVDDGGNVYKGVLSEDFFNCIYYSVITLTTLGYGDMKASPTKEGMFMKGVSVFEVGLGILFLTLFLAILLSVKANREDT